MTRIVLALLVLTVLGYAGVFVYRRAAAEPETAVAVADVHRDTVNITGVMVREETLLTGKRAYCTVTAAHGSRVAAGAELGLAYDSAESLQRARRLDTLGREIALVEEILSGAGETDRAERADAARSAVLSLTADIARHDMSDIRVDALRVRSLLLNGGADVTRTELNAMKQEQRTLLQRAAGETETLLAPAGGIFTPLVDGYENINPAALTNLTPSALDTLLSHAGTIDARSYGKLAPSFNWYLAAVLDEASVRRLRVGESFTIDLSRYRAGEPVATLQSIGASEDGYCVVIFSCLRSLTDTLSLRSVSCPVVVNSVSGLRLPAAAVRRDEIGNYYVLLGGGAAAQRADVTVLCEDEEGVLLEGALLHEGSVVLLGSRIREGQLLD